MGGGAGGIVCATELYLEPPKLAYPNGTETYTEVSVHFSQLWATGSVSVTALKMDSLLSDLWFTF